MQKSPLQVNHLFENILPVLTQKQKQDCEMKISEKEVIEALKSLRNNKWLGDGGLIKPNQDFYKNFWSKLKEPSMNSISQKNYYFTKASH